MVLTQAQATAACNHVLNNVLACTNNTPLVLALNHNGITEIYDLLTLFADDIDNLDYVDNEGNPHGVPLGEQNLLKLFIAYYASCIQNGSSIPNTLEDWNGLIHDTFTEWRSQNLQHSVDLMPPLPVHGN